MDGVPTSGYLEVKFIHHRQMFITPLKTEWQVR
jgi:hypothetical protein